MLIQHEQVVSALLVLAAQDVLNQDIFLFLNTTIIITLLKIKRKNN